MRKETENTFCESDPGANSTFWEQNLIVPPDPKYTQGEEITQAMKMRWESLRTISESAYYTAQE